MLDLSATAQTEKLPQPTYLANYKPPTHIIEQLSLDFDLHDAVTNVCARMIVQPNPDSSDGFDLVLDGINLELILLVINGETQTEDQYQINDTNLIIPNLTKRSTLEITTRIYPQNNTALSGLYKSSGKYCTQCEAEGFRRIMYFLDRPDVLTEYTTTIHADAARFPYLLSNGNLIEQGIEEDGRHFVTWHDPFRKPSYLFALVAGDFDVVTDKFITCSDKRVDLRIYVESGYAQQAMHAMFALKQAMRWDERVYGREYDLNIYMIVAVSDFNMGAMENKGLNIFNTKYILARPNTATDNDYINILSVIGHEYFHNWSGNRVTCRDWFQLSLKEGLTIFRDQCFSEDELATAVMRIREVNGLREVQFSEDKGPLAHAVQPDSYIEISNFYTTTIYNKGAELLRMLRTILGEVVFYRAMEVYFTRYDGYAVTIDDYISVMSEVSGRDLTQFKRWYKAIGTPRVKISTQYDDTVGTYEVECTQLPGNDKTKRHFPLLIPIRLSLFTKEGASIAFTPPNENEMYSEYTLILSVPTQKFKFGNVKQAPIPSWLRNFSAPIELEYDYSRTELFTLALHDTDPFNRWEAGQKYAAQIIAELMHPTPNHAEVAGLNAIVHLYHELLSGTPEDKFLHAEMLSLPSEKYLAQPLTIIDPVVIHHAREQVIAALATRLTPLWRKTYFDLHSQEYTNQNQFDLKAIGQRQLKNRALFYLASLVINKDIAYQQFIHAYQSNMTDAEASLLALVQLDVAERQEALELFYTTWQHEPLVVDKWFMLQALSKLPTTLNHVQNLLSHPAFDIKNPNKVYALIGTFAQRNLVNFHALSGDGYVFLRRTVAELDSINPQIAAAMLKPLTQWRRYDKQRQNLMRSQIDTLLTTHKLSKDVYELAIKSLAK